MAALDLIRAAAAGLFRALVCAVFMVLSPLHYIVGRAALCKGYIYAMIGGPRLIYNCKGRGRGLI